MTIIIHGAGISLVGKFKVARKDTSLHKSFASSGFVSFRMTLAFYCIGNEAAGFEERSFSEEKFASKPAASFPNDTPKALSF